MENNVIGQAGCLEDMPLLPQQVNLSLEYPIRVEAKFYAAISFYAKIMKRKF